MSQLEEVARFRSAWSQHTTFAHIADMTVGLSERAASTDRREAGAASLGAKLGGRPSVGTAKPTPALRHDHDRYGGERRHAPTVETIVHAHAVTVPAELVRTSKTFAAAVQAATDGATLDAVDRRSLQQALAPLCKADVAKLYAELSGLIPKARRVELRRAGRLDAGPATIAAITRLFEPAKSQFADPVVEAHEFKVSRGLDEYIHVFGAKFTEHLAALDGQSRLLDLGCGNGRFLAQYLHVADDQPYRGHLACEDSWAAASEIAYRDPSTKAKVTGVTYKSDHASTLGEQPTDRWTMHVGRYFEEIPDSELERYDMIVDNFGVLLYTHNFSEALAKSLDHLSDDGALYLYQGDSGEFFYSKVTLPSLKFPESSGVSDRSS